MVEKLSQQQNVLLNKYLKEHPKASRSAAIQLLFGNKGQHSTSSKGLKIEHNTNGAAKPNTIYLQSGRKVVYTRTKDGKLACKYYGADGTLIKPEYFKKVEGNISISADNNSYTVTKNGKSVKHAAKNPRKAQIDQNIVKLNNQEKSLKKTKKEQGFIGKSWDWFKNTSAGRILNLDSSNKAQKQIDDERKLLVQLRDNPDKQIDPKKFEKVTGQKYTKANLTKFQQGEISSAKAKVDAYKEGQTIAVDVASDLVSGVVSFGIYTAAVAAAPFTGGASIVVGVAAAGVAGAATKVAIKAADTIGTNRKYNLFSKEAASDALMGGVNGLIAPLTAGAGGAVAKTIAIRAGVQVVKETGKQATKQVLSQATKNAVKRGLGRTFISQLKESIIHPNSYKLVGGTLSKRLTAYGAEGVVDGGLSGGVYSGVETAKNGGDAGDILKATAIGFGTGALMGGIMTSAAHGKGIITGNKGATEDVASKGATKEVVSDAVENPVVKNADDVVQTPKAQAFFGHKSELYAVQLETQEVSASGKKFGLGIFDKAKKALSDLKNKVDNMFSDTTYEVEVVAHKSTPDTKLKTEVVRTPASDKLHTKEQKISQVAKHIFSEEEQKLISTLKQQKSFRKGQEVPRFTDEQIHELMIMRKTKPEFIDKLLNEQSFLMYKFDKLEDIKLINQLHNEHKLLVEDMIETSIDASDYNTIINKFKNMHEDDAIDLFKHLKKVCDDCPSTGNSYITQICEDDNYFTILSIKDKYGEYIFNDMYLLWDLGNKNLKNLSNSIKDGSFDKLIKQTNPEDNFYEFRNLYDDGNFQICYKSLPIAVGYKKIVDIKFDSKGKLVKVAERKTNSKADSSSIIAISESKTPDGGKVTDNGMLLGYNTETSEGLEKYLYDKNGNVVRKDEIIPSKVRKGEFEINVTKFDKNGKPTIENIGSVKTYGSKSQGSRSRRRVTSPTGVVTRQIKIKGPKGIGTEYKILDKNKKVLYENKRIHTQISENHYISTHNGQRYDMKFEGENLIIGKIDKNGKLSETITLGPDILDPQLKDLYKQLPTDYFYKIKELGIKVELGGEAEANNACYCAPKFDKKTFKKTEPKICMSEGCKNDPFVFAHELGHALDDLKFKDKLREDKIFKSLYSAEMEKFKQSSGLIEGSSIDYFTLVDEGYNHFGEFIAETHALISGLDQTSIDLGIRSVVLQQNFPRTIAYVGKKLEMPIEEFAQAGRKTGTDLDIAATRISHSAPAPKPQGAENKPRINDLDFDDFDWDEIFKSATESTPHTTQKTEIEMLRDAIYNPASDNSYKISREEFTPEEIVEVLPQVKTQNELNIIKEKLNNIIKNSNPDEYKKLRSVQKLVGAKEDEFAAKCYSHMDELADHQMIPNYTDFKRIITQQIKETDNIDELIHLQRDLQSYKKQVPLDFSDIEKLINAKSSKLHLDNILKNAKTIDSLETHLKQAQTPEAKAIIAKRIEERKSEVLKAYDDFKAGKSIPDYETTEDIVRIKIEDCKTLKDIENLTNDLRLRDRKVAEMNLNDYGAGAGSDMIRAKSKSIRTDILNDFTSRIEKINTEKEAEAIKNKFLKFQFSDNYYSNLSSNNEMHLLYEQVYTKINDKLKSFKPSKLDIGYDENNNAIKIDDLDFDEIIRKSLNEEADKKKIKPQAVTRNELKASLQNGKKVYSQISESQINIPSGKNAAPGAKFLETDEAFKQILTDNKYDVLFMHQKYKITGDLDEFVKDMYAHYVKETDIGQFAPELNIKSNTGTNAGSFNHENNSLMISKDYINKESDVAHNVAHELNHWFQDKEMLITTPQGPELLAYNLVLGNLKEMVKNGDITSQADFDKYLREWSVEDAAKLRITYQDLINSTKYPHNNDPASPYFQKANQYFNAQSNYEHTGDNYWNNFTEVESERRGYDAQKAYDKIINEDLALENQAIDLIMVKIHERFGVIDNNTKLQILELAIEDLKNPAFANYSVNDFVNEFIRKLV